MVNVISKGTKITNAIAKLLRQYIKLRQDRALDKREELILDLSKLCWLFGVLQSGYGTENTWKDVVQDAWLSTFFSGCPIWSAIEDGDEVMLYQHIIYSM